MTGLWQVRCRASIARRENTRDYSLLGPQTLVPKEAGLNTTCTRQDKLVTSQNQCRAHKQVPSWEGGQALAALLKWMQQLNIVFYSLGETSINTHDLVIRLI